MNRNRGACLICGADLEYLEEAVKMECSRCGGSFFSDARCQKGHYICDECHSKEGIRLIREECLASQSKNPVELLQKIMEDPAIYMHGPEHHILVGSALLTAYKNAGGELPGEGENAFAKALKKMEDRGKAVPGGVCGMWGSCGAGISAGTFFSIISGATPLTEESWSLSNRMTAACLSAIAAEGGPRCCKRDSFLSVKTAVAFTAEHTGIRMELPAEIHCDFSAENKQCRGEKCPFY